MNISRKEYRNLNMGKKAKYRNVKITHTNGIAFDSLKEYRRYVELLVLQNAGFIHGLQCQVPYTLVEAVWEPIMGKRGLPLKRKKCVERAVIYVADFVYQEDSKTIVEDTKGFKTPEYILKRKLMLLVHGIKVKEI